MCGPVVKMRGPGRLSAAIRRRSSSNFSFHCPGSRNAVIAVTELPQRQLRIALDMEVQIDQARDDRAARRGRSDRRRRAHVTVRGRSDPRDPIAVDHDAAVSIGCSAGAVDDRGRCRAPACGACRSAAPWKKGPPRHTGQRRGRWQRALMKSSVGSLHDLRPPRRMKKFRASPLVRQRPRCRVARRHDGTAARRS